MRSKSQRPSLGLGAGVLQDPADLGVSAATIDPRHQFRKPFGLRHPGRRAAFGQPAVIDELDVEPAHRRRLSVKPGLTCLWQISGRNQIVEFKHWVRLDLEYIDNWSLWLDFKILFRTIPAVILGTGAK